MRHCAGERINLAKVVQSKSVILCRPTWQSTSQKQTTYDAPDVILVTDFSAHNSETTARVVYGVTTKACHVTCCSMSRVSIAPNAQQEQVNLLYFCTTGKYAYIAGPNLDSQNIGRRGQWNASNLTAVVFAAA